jgi:predicted transcriptional regulator
VEELIKHLKALVLLELQRGDIAQPEVLLARAGYTHREIAEMIGKSQMAVSKAISRAKTATQGEDDA